MWDLSDEESVQTLLNSLHDPDPMVRVAAVTSLKMHSGLSENGKNELLERFLKDQDPRVRNTAASHFSATGISVGRVSKRTGESYCK